MKIIMIILNVLLLVMAIHLTVQDWVAIRGFEAFLASLFIITPIVNLIYVFRNMYKSKKHVCSC